MRITRLLMVGLLVCSPALAEELKYVKPERVGVSEERLERISDMARGYVESGKIPGIITMVNRGGRLVHFETAGVRGVNDDRALKPDDLFRIYSMSKPVTALQRCRSTNVVAFTSVTLSANLYPSLKISR